jgi:nucleotide-binding universal stress UspA family protein
VLGVAEAWGASNQPAFGAYGLGEWPVTDAQVEALQAAEQRALKQMRQVAEDAAARLRDAHPDWAIRSESCGGAAGWNIVRRAEEWGADLIAIGSRGRSAIGRTLLGSVSQAVVREAPCAVRVVRGRLGVRGASAHLLVGFDGSADAEAAVEAVAGRAWPAGSAVRLLTAMDGRLSAAVPVPRRRAGAGRGEAPWMRRLMEDPVERLRRAGLVVSSAVKLGDPRAVLVEEARRWPADSLCVGARGLTGVKRFLLGSVSTAVAMQAPCPVEVVRPARAAAGRGPMRRQREAAAAG